jgi:hypothetical protein
MTENPVTLTKDGAGIVMSPPLADSSDGSSIRVPQVNVNMGADFGEEITDDNRFFAAHREPVAGFLVYGVPADVVEKWFSINDLNTKNPDPELDRGLQTELRKLKYKLVLRTFDEFKRLYGNTLMVGFFDDASKLTDLATEKPATANLAHLTVFPKISYAVFQKDENPESFRYGLPLVYQVNNGTQSFRAHWTRCFEYVGDSILDLIWDDLTCGRNIRWGVGQWVYRVGGGFAVIEYPKEYSPSPGAPLIATTPAKLQEWASSAEFKDITHRKYICLIKDTMGFHFEGAQGAALNPEPFFDTNLKQISIATGIPKSILEGAEAGALTGSEKNDQQYYKKISGEQSSLEDVNRWVIDQLDPLRTFTNAVVDSAQKSAGSVLKRMLRKVVPQIVKDQATGKQIDYEIVWNNAFQLSALDEARIRLLNEQANQTELQYSTIDEVRADNDKPPLPMGEGEVVLSLKAPVNSFPNSQLVQPNQNNAQNLGGQQQGLDAALPTMRVLIQPIIKQVFDGHMTHDVAVQQGTALIGFYCDTEKERALEYVRGKFQNPTLGISPEQEREFVDQKARFTKDFLEILGKAEKLVKAKLP